MIALSRPGGARVIVNADLIETVEALGETTAVTLTTGNVLAVSDSPDDVVAAVVAYRRRVAGH
jgi:uncharacterized protein YlzI (FlbEa/FlbD family)